MDWSIEQVCKYLQGHGFDQDVVQAFKTNHIDGFTFISALNEEALKKDLEISSMGYRVKLLRLRQQLQASSLQTDSSAFERLNLPWGKSRQFVPIEIYPCISSSLGEDHAAAPSAINNNKPDLVLKPKKTRSIPFLPKHKIALNSLVIVENGLETDEFYLFAPLNNKVLKGELLIHQKRLRRLLLKGISGNMKRNIEMLPIESQEFKNTDDFEPLSPLTDIMETSPILPVRGEDEDEELPTIIELDSTTTLESDDEDSESDEARDFSDPGSYIPEYPVKEKLTTPSLKHLLSEVNTIPLGKRAKTGVLDSPVKISPESPVVPAISKVEKLSTENSMVEKPTTASYAVEELEIESGTVPELKKSPVIPLKSPAQVTWNAPFEKEVDTIVIEEGGGGGGGLQYSMAQDLIRAKSFPEIREKILQVYQKVATLDSSEIEVISSGQKLEMLAYNAVAIAFFAWCSHYANLNYKGVSKFTLLDKKNYKGFKASDFWLEYLSLCQKIGPRKAFKELTNSNGGIKLLGQGIKIPFAKAFDSASIATDSIVEDTQKRRKTEMVLINPEHGGDQDDIYIPSFFLPYLLPHQLEGVRFMWKNIIGSYKSEPHGCILAHCMGLGKTFQAIVLITTLLLAQSHKRKGIPSVFMNKRVMVICPSSLVEHWNDEFKLWLPEKFLKIVGDRICISAGRMEPRLNDLHRWYHLGGVLIIGYEIFRHTLQLKTGKDDIRRYLLSPGASLVVADEGHSLRNDTAKITQLLKTIKTPSRICITGTPMMNNLMDWIRPGYLDPLPEFRSRFIVPIEAGLSAACTIQERRQSRRWKAVFMQLVEDIINRKSIKVMEHRLPKISEFYLCCNISDLQVSTYNQLLLEGADKFNIIAAKGRLRTICNHPWIYFKIYGNYPDCSTLATTDMDGRVIQTVLRKIPKKLALKDLENSYKMMLLFTFIQEIAKSGSKDKLLIFSHSLGTLDFIAENMHIRGFNFSRLDGSTVFEERGRLINEFNKLEKNFVFLISTEAGGLGINLIGANRVILFDSDWNPSVEEQAVGRAYRFGQEKPVYVYRMLTFKTFEEKQHFSRVSKLALTKQIVDKDKKLSLSSKDSSFFSPVHKLIENDRPPIPLTSDALLNRVIHRNGDCLVSVMPEHMLWQEYESDCGEDEEEGINRLLEEERARIKRHKPISL